MKYSENVRFKNYHRIKQLKSQGITPGKMIFDTKTL